MASSTDVIGPLTRSAEDAAIVLDVMSGRDVLDGTTIERDTESYDAPKLDLAGKKIGVIKEYFGEGLDAGVKTQIEAAIEKFKKSRCGDC
jgi:aspartyl-tRNA(Asn)/glutamyl-tRNA(Gln) amidotransferase subunit A